MSRDGTVTWSPTWTAPGGPDNLFTPITSGTVVPGGTGTLAWPYDLWYADITTDQPAGVIVNTTYGSYAHQVMVAVLRGDAMEFDNFTIAIGSLAGPGQASITTTQDAGNDAFIVAWLGNAGLLQPYTTPDPDISPWQPFFNGNLPNQATAWSLIRSEERR